MRLYINEDQKDLLKHLLKIHEEHLRRINYESELSYWQCRALTAIEDITVKIEIQEEYLEKIKAKKVN